MSYVLECEGFDDIHLIGVYVLVSFSHMILGRHKNNPESKYLNMITFL